MSQDTGKDTSKQQDNASQDNVDALKKEKAELLKEVMAKKEKLEAYEKKAEQDKQNQLAEQGKYKELIEQLTPKVQRLDKVMPVLEKIYELEVADIPEDKRELIPTGDVETRLEWVKTAKSKGLFKTESEKKQPPAPSIQSKSSQGTVTSAEYLTWGKDDVRVTKLPLADQKVWLEHQRAKQQAPRWV